MQRRTALPRIAAAFALPWAASPARAQDACAVFTPASQGAVSPDAALQRLKDGHERFASGRTTQCDLREQVRATAKQQSPVAAVLGCIDSRVPPELVFDQRLGDIFAARVAGNFVNDDIIGSLEFACAVAGARLVVVLGHSECGAIKGAIDDVKMGHLTAALANIRPSLARLKYSGVATSKDAALVQQLAERNARDAATALTDRSPVLAGLVRDGRLKIVAAMHDVATGAITWYA